MQILVAGYVIFGSLRVLFIFSGNIFRCSSNIKLESSIRPRFFWDDDWEPLVVLNTNGGWFFFCFATENDFMSLFSRVWIKVHFPLKRPVIYYFQIITEIICRCLNVTYNTKQRSTIYKQLYIGSEAFCKIIHVNKKQQRTRDGTLWYSSIDIFPCPLRTTRCFLCFKKSCKRFSKFLDIPCWVSF